MKCFNFTCGIVSGLALGILFAPRKGEETRKQLKESMNSCQSRLERMFGKGEEELSALRETLEDQTEDITQEVREKLLKLIKETQRKYRFMSHDSESL